jgi:hypothetical protein
VLTAGTGSPVPAPGRYTYSWLVDGSPLAGTDNPTFTPTAAELGHRISVQVIAVKDGYASSTDVSDQTAPVADVPDVTAPTLTLTTDVTTLRRGGSATLTWDSTGAATVTPGGDWPSTDNPLPSSGTMTVSPTVLGTHTYTLSATNDGGTATAEVVLTVVREATHLAVTVPGHRHPGGYFRVRASTLDPGETYTIRFGSQILLHGVANAAGQVDRKVKVPTGARIGRHQVVVTGASADRKGHAVITVRRRR